MTHDARDPRDKQPPASEEDDSPTRGDGRGVSAAPPESSLEDERGDVAGDDTPPLPPPPVRSERPAGSMRSRATDQQDIDDDQFDDDFGGDDDGEPRLRRTGDDAPAPRWRDRRSRAVGWRSRDVVRAVAIVLGVWAGALLVWRTSQLWLVSFLGILFGLATSSGVDALHARGLRVIPRGVLAAIIVLGTTGAIIGFFVWSGPTLATQLAELRTRLPQALDQVEDWARQQGGFVAGIVLGGVDTVAGPDTIVVAPAAAEPVAPPPPSRAPDTASATRVADSVQRTVLAARDSLLARDTAMGLDPMVDSLFLSLSESARAAALASARDAVRDIELQSARENLAAASQRQAPAANVSVVIPDRDTTAANGGSLRERALGSLRGATRYLFPFLTSTATVLAGLILVIFLAIYIAAAPETYKRGTLLLFPRKSRARAREVLGAVAIVLRKWLVTQLIAMVVIGTVTTVVLYALDVEAALPLGIIAGLLEFIPNIGPVLSAVPAIAMGFVDSPEKALWVAIAYWAIQFLENQLLIPLLMQEGVDLPPALTLLAQAVLALVFGFLGLFVAVPLVAAGLVTVRMLYVEDVVGEGLDPFDREDSPEVVRLASRGILAGRGE